MSPSLLLRKSVCFSTTCRAWRELQPRILDRNFCIGCSYKQDLLDVVGLVFCCVRTSQAYHVWPVGQKSSEILTYLMAPWMKANRSRKVSTCLTSEWRRQATGRGRIAAVQQSCVVDGLFHLFQVWCLSHFDARLLEEQHCLACGWLANTQTPAKHVTNTNFRLLCHFTPAERH